ncbi:hypothetical protein NC651_003216 [Populus alba x Populus x berolinensis]|nr:hypothetical protein NC651_003216 [Populus alba x Populus x berolinensis]
MVFVEGCENGNLGYAEALHKEDSSADVSLRLRDLLPICYSGFGGKITRILLFCADCVAICVFGWRRMLQLSSFNSLIEKLLVDGMVFLASLWYDAFRLSELPKLHSFESPTESDLETGKQMFYQKNNLQYAATDAMVSWKLYQVLKSLPDAKDAPLTIQVRNRKDLLLYCTQIYGRAKSLKNEVPACSKKSDLFVTRECGCCCHFCETKGRGQVRQEILALSSSNVCGVE